MCPNTTGAMQITQAAIFPYNIQQYSKHQTAEDESDRTILQRLMSKGRHIVNSEAKIAVQYIQAKAATCNC